MPVLDALALETLCHLGATACTPTSDPTPVTIERPYDELPISRRRSTSCVQPRNDNKQAKVQRRVSFSQHPPKVAETHGADDYNRRVPEGLEDNFSFLQLCFIRMDIERAKREMITHPDSHRTSRGLPPQEPSVAPMSEVL